MCGSGETFLVAGQPSRGLIRVCAPAGPRRSRPGPAVRGRLRLLSPPGSMVAGGRGKPSLSLSYLLVLAIIRRDVVHDGEARNRVPAGTIDRTVSS